MGKNIREKMKGNNCIEEAKMPNEKENKGRKSKERRGGEGKDGLRDVNI